MKNSKDPLWNDFSFVVFYHQNYLSQVHRELNCNNGCITFYIGEPYKWRFRRVVASHESVRRE